MVVKGVISLIESKNHYELAIEQNEIKKLMILNISILIDDSYKTN